MKSLLIISLVMLACSASSAHGAIYRWTDNKGTTHYTNSECEIPGRYRARAKVMDLGIKEKTGDSSLQQDAPPDRNRTPYRGEQVQPEQQTEPSDDQGPPASRIGQHGRRNGPSILGD